MKPTMHDVANVAGVSLATVDRVINDRPNVRERTRQKVIVAIERLGFSRDISAANLARQRIYQFDFIVPDNDNPFMKALRREIAAARERSRFERTIIELIDAPAFDEGALEAALEEALARRPDGVAFVAVDSDRIRAVARRLMAAGVGVVTLVSDVANDARDHYVGIDNVAAGCTVAGLLGRFIGERRGAVAVMTGSLSLRDHRDRLEGFRSVMQAECPTLEILAPLEGRDDPEVVKRLVSRLMSEREDLVGLYSIGAGNDGLVSALAQNERRPRFVVAHELDATTAKALREGLIDAILAQDAGHEIRSAIRVLRADADHRSVIPAEERIRIDILLKYNLPPDNEASHIVAPNPER
jgi:LacI family transcriptional regulator